MIQKRCNDDAKDAKMKQKMKNLSIMSWANVLKHMTYKPLIKNPHGNKYG